MEEGEKLSKRQMDMEQAGRTLRAKLSESESDKEKLAALVAAEEERAEGLARTKARLEREADAAAEAHRAELAAQREQYEGLLAKARSEQVGGRGRGRVLRAAAAEPLPWLRGRGCCRLLQWLPPRWLVGWLVSCLPHLRRRPGTRAAGRRGGARARGGEGRLGAAAARGGGARRGAGRGAGGDARGAGEAAPGGQEGCCGCWGRAAQPGTARPAQPWAAAGKQCARPSLLLHRAPSRLSPAAARPDPPARPAPCTRQAADLREEMLKQDLQDLERRCQASEVGSGRLLGRLGACPG
jgi:hypothetical protein